MKHSPPRTRTSRATASRWNLRHPLLALVTVFPSVRNFAAVVSANGAKRDVTVNLTSGTSEFKLHVLD